MQAGIYESLITQALEKRLQQLNEREYFLKRPQLNDKTFAVRYLSAHLAAAITQALSQLKKDELPRQIEIANHILTYLSQQIKDYDFNDDLIAGSGTILKAVFNKLQSDHADLELYLNEITPLSGLTQSELFTGANAEITMEQELKREILSADSIDLLVSFIKWGAIRILEPGLKSFTARGGRLRVLTTTYMGASDAKAIDFFTTLPNTEIKVSYNSKSQRMHAKAYMFRRNTGFHTAYIGSSNLSQAAITTGLEWNVKVTTKEIPHIISKFNKTFESYWLSAEFEPYDATQATKLKTALSNNQMPGGTGSITTFFDLKPYQYQQDILEKLMVERNVHNSMRNLVVAATGTGKTIISAFDFMHYRRQYPNATLLFIAHRQEILKQAMDTYRHVLKDQNFGELMTGGYTYTQKNALFASVQTLNNQTLETLCPPAYYNYIVLDEVHHAAANTYQKIINYFTPHILLGLTATPERMDGRSILPDFNNRTAAEIRLPDALNQQLLCPFQYFGVTDAVDYRSVKWNNGRYNTADLTNVLTANDARVGDIINNLQKYLTDLHNVTALCFCASVRHAAYMHQRFTMAGLRAGFLTSENAAERHNVLTAFKNKSISYLFVVDIFNEGVDIPEVDTVLFLRPTESLTIFLQQLGRGLRLHPGKDVLTVLDFIGLARDEYDYALKFRALIGKSNNPLVDDVERDFPQLPLGCSIVLEKQAKAVILKNIKRATDYSTARIINLIRSYSSHTTLPFTLQNFIQVYNLQLVQLYKRGTFTELCHAAAGEAYDAEAAAPYKTMLGKKWSATNSLVYFSFLLKLFKADCQLEELPDNEENKIMALMLVYDFYARPPTNMTLTQALLHIGAQPAMVIEIIQYLQVKLEAINFSEFECRQLNFTFPLQVHARYTRDQILVALGLNTLSNKSSNREGVAENKDLNAEVFFINLQKDKGDFSPTTMYDDYAISETLFHFQSQNSASPDKGKGLSYIQQGDNGKKILLFVREAKEDPQGYTQGYVFLGSANFVSYTGSKPMNIIWRLHTPMPHFLWQQSAKLRTG